MNQVEIMENVKNIQKITIVIAQNVKFGFVQNVKPISIMIILKIILWLSQSQKKNPNVSIIIHKKQIYFAWIAIRKFAIFVYLITGIIIIITQLELMNM